MAVGVSIGNREVFQQSLLPQLDIKFKQTTSGKTDGIKRLYHADNLDDYCAFDCRAGKSTKKVAAHAKDTATFLQSN